MKRIDEPFFLTIKGDDGLSALRNALEVALYNSGVRMLKIKKENTKEKQKLYDDVTMNGVLMEFLNCSSHDFYIFEASFSGPLSYNYMANMLPFLNKNFLDRSRDIEKRFEKLKKKCIEFETIYFGNMKNAEMATGYKFCSFFKAGKDKNINVPESGTGYYDDRKGFRFVVINKGFVNKFNKKTLDFQIICSSRIRNAELKVARLIADFEAYSRAHSIYTDGAYSISGEFIDVTHTPWDALKIPAEVMDKVNFHITDYIQRFDRMERAGLRTSRGIIICGNPGNGKTLLGKILATNLGIPLIWATAKEIVKGMSSPLVNVLDETFKFLEFISPAILLIEDGDIFLQNRSQNNQAVDLSEFLNRIDGLKSNRGVITIMTANNPELLDEAVKNRPKRFDIIIEFPNPPLKERADILRAALKKMVRENEAGLLKTAAERLDGFTGAHVAEFADRLIMAAVYRNRKYITGPMINSELKKFGFKPIKRGSNKIEIGFAGAGGGSNDHSGRKHEKQ